MICNPCEEILFLTRSLISKELLTLGPVPTRAEVRQFVITTLEKEKRPEKWPFEISFLVRKGAFIDDMGPVEAKNIMKTVLFVCVHNSGRSQMAEAFFNHLAGGRARAISAGTNPDAALDPVVVKVMKELGIDLSGKNPKMLTPEMMGQADEVVSMGCGVEGVCPARYIKTEDWGIADPKGRPVEEVRRIRDEIRTRVEQMLEELSSSGEQG